MVGSDTQATWAKGTLRSSHPVPWEGVVSTAPALLQSEREAELNSRVLGEAANQKGAGAAGLHTGQVGREPPFHQLCHGQGPAGSRRGGSSDAAAPSFPSQPLKHTYAPVEHRACRQLEGKEQPSRDLQRQRAWVRS